VRFVCKKITVEIEHPLAKSDIRDWSEQTRNVNFGDQLTIKGAAGLHAVAIM